MAELIAADLKSQHSVLAVLTDLINHWQFFFLGEGKSVITFTHTRDQAVALLRNELTNTQDTQANTGAAEQQLSRRMKFVKILKDSNISTNIAPMVDFFDLMTEGDIKAKQILT